MQREEQGQKHRGVKHAQCPGAAAARREWPSVVMCAVYIKSESGQELLGCRCEERWTACCRNWPPGQGFLR